ncbi:hypothetical protein LX64_00717 [Chitinophaga skermanii]|uniref:Uncharacterized protein n=1 Tax=Chitinophaga skermanii TaxID=331697 RepID=A0A327R2P4_9BACT|nr:hypothetical protein [Chitinophaga skermanii]RAJ11109.1 hypothetical protein LX64_00717 [Chitinophaga skermanii]
MRNPLSFSFQKPTPWLYFVLVIVVPIFLGISVAYWYPRSAWLFALSMVVPLVVGMILLLRNRRGKDEIVFTRDGFDSLVYGNIAYSDIVKIHNSVWLPKPSLKLSLKNGKKATWLLSYRANLFNNEEDIIQFERFTAQLTMELLKFEKKNPFTYIVNEPSATNIPEGALSRQAQQSTARNKRPTWMIPVTAVFAITAFIRTCGKDLFKRKEPDFAKYAMEQRARYEENIDRSKAVIDSFVRSQGAMYLYTNDTAAKLVMLPDVAVVDVTGIEMFRNQMANDSLEKYIQHPDSFAYKTIVISGRTFKPMTKTILNMNDSANTTLYFRVYDSTLHIINGYDRRRNPGPVDSSKFPVFDMTTAIPVYDVKDVYTPISETFPGMHMMLAQVKHRPTTFKIYLTGRENEGVTREVFDRSVAALEKQLKAVEVDVSGFVKKTFNE